MRKYTILLFVMGLACSTNMNAQEEEKKDFGIKFSGFVKNDFFLDSRQTFAPREGHFLLWPSAEDPDEDGEDINARPNFNFLAIQSRLSGKITGPDAFGAKTSGLIEGDFFAQLNDNINLFRLRHAFIKLKWENIEILTGQYWNPLFVTSCFPGTVSFNTGTPLQSFARNPQIRFTYTDGDIKIIAAALSQRDFTSRGINGASSEYLRNSVLPDIHLQVQYNIDDILVGGGFAFKSIVPRLSSQVGPFTYKVKERVNGITVIGYARAKLDPVTVKVQGRYGENIPDVLSISGFAVKDVVDPVTGEQEYTPFRNLSAWGEIHNNGSTMQVGVFGGLLLNLGTKDAMNVPVYEVYGLGTNIAALLRVSPRITFISNKFKVAGEAEFTSAAYGNDGTFDENYKPSSTTSVHNLRLLLSTVYSF